MPLLSCILIGSWSVYDSCFTSLSFSFSFRDLSLRLWGSGSIANKGERLLAVLRRRSLAGSVLALGDRERLDALKLTPDITFALFYDILVL